MKTKSFFILTLATTLALPTFAQKNEGKKANKTNETETKSQNGKDNNMMLNAADETSPRFINVGLPEGTGGTVVSENGMLISPDTYLMMPNQAWRQDGSFQKPESWSLSKTAIKMGEVGVSMATNTRKGQKKFVGHLNLHTNSYGLMGGNLSLAGPMKNNWFYHVNAFVNMDPGSTNPSWTNFLDKTFLLKGIVTKRYNNGELSFQYKYMNSQKLNDNVAPYIFHKDKQVTQLDNFEIGRNSYATGTDNHMYKNPLTGEMESVSYMKDTGSEVHAFDILGNNKLGKGLTLDYTLRYQHAETGKTNFSFNAIKETGAATAKSRYIYADNNNEQVYTGYFQNVQMGIAPRRPSDYVNARVELNKKGKNFNYSAGYNGYLWHVNKATQGTYSYLSEVAPNPRQIVHQVYQNGVWVNKQGENTPDQYGQWNYNGAYFYYDGNEYKNAIYAMGDWKPAKNVKIDLGARLEWHHLAGSWMNKEDRASAPDKTWASGGTSEINRNFWNKSFTATVTYNILPTFGLVGDAYYIETSDGLNVYKSANDPLSKTNVIPYLAAGVFYNSPIVSVISRFSRISRSNLYASGSFANAEGESTKLSFLYDIKTVGWTTDAVITPFKGASLHLMLTLQNPVYKNFEFEVFGEKFNYDGVPARTCSKTLIEIDPSYSFGAFRIWASARYFSKASCAYPGTLFFPSRWETFAGIDYQATKKIAFNLSVVNLLNQTGAQGRIVGTNTAMDPTPYYDQPVAGTFIRPFTIDLKTKITF